MKNVKTMKMMAASAGAGALIAMGGFAMAGNGWADPADPASPGPVTPEEATLGATTVESPPPMTPETSSAVPPIEGPAPLPPEEQGLPG